MGVLGRTFVTPGQTVEGSITVRGLAGHYAVAPAVGRTILFGRNRPDVHVAVGEDDAGISRRHGLLRCDGRMWWLVNTGRTPLRMGGQRIFAGDEPQPVPTGRTLLTLVGARHREHVLEVRVQGPEPAGRIRLNWSTEHPMRPLPPISAAERLVLTALCRQHLERRPNPSPQSWRQIHADLDRADPTGRWTHRRAEHLVKDVRDRYTQAGIEDLQRDEVGEPVGNALNENLVEVLLSYAVIGPLDWHLLKLSDPD